MRITFLNPPFVKNFSRSQRSPAVTKSGTLYYPMWLASAAGVAAERGHEVDLIDAPADARDMQYVKRRIEDFGPALVVMDTSTPSIYNDVEVAESLKAMRPGLFVMLVGTHVSALPESTLGIARDVDAIAVGEYDHTVLDVAGAIEKSGDIGEVPGLCIRGEGGKPVRTAPRPMIDDLDVIPYVSRTYRKFLDPTRYFNPNALYPMVTISTSRGCPFKCTFCVYPQTMMGQQMRTRSVGHVLGEIEYIVREYPGIKAIFFEDDTLAGIKKRCIEICQGMIDRGIRISWTANSRADLDYETMRIMKESGCRCLCVGFESGSQDLLDNIKKRTRVDRMEQFMADARRAGILIHGCFMVGLPGETKETMRMTLDLAKRLNPDTMQFYPIMVYPGTEAYNWYREEGYIITEDFSKWLTPAGLHNTVIRTEHLKPHELVEFCDLARREFYLRPSYFLYTIRRMIAHPEEISRILKSARTFLKYLIKGSDVQKNGC